MAGHWHKTACPGGTAGLGHVWDRRCDCPNPARVVTGADGGILVRHCGEPHYTPEEWKEVQRKGREFKAEQSRLAR